MAVNVLDSTRIQITDWRPDADTEYSHAGQYTVDGETIELTGYELGDHRLIKLNGAQYKALHAPTVMATTPPVTLYPLTGVSKYFTIAHNDAFWCPRETTIMLRFKYVSTHGGNGTLLTKGDGTFSGLEMEIGIDGSNHPYFDDGVNISSKFTDLTISTTEWTTLGLRISDDAPAGTTSTLTMWVNGVSQTLTVSPVAARTMGTGLIYISANSINPSTDGVAAYWDYVALWDEPLLDNVLLNAMNYLKMQEQGLVLNAPMPYVTAATVTDLATAYEVEM